MLRIQKSLRDVHGLTFVNPVIIINNLNYRASASKTSNPNPASLVNGERVVSDMKDCSLSFNALIYVNDDAVTAGCKPLPLKDKNGNEWFSITFDSPLTETSDTALVQRAEQYLVDTILPLLEVQA